MKRSEQTQESLSTMGGSDFALSPHFHGAGISMNELTQRSLSTMGASDFALSPLFQGAQILRGWTNNLSMERSDQTNHLWSEVPRNEHTQGSGPPL